MFFYTLFVFSVIFLNDGYVTGSHSYSIFTLSFIIGLQVNFPFVFFPYTLVHKVVISN